MGKSLQDQFCWTGIDLYDILNTNLLNAQDWKPWCVLAVQHRLLVHCSLTLLQGVSRNSDITPASITVCCRVDILVEADKK